VLPPGILHIPSRVGKGGKGGWGGKQAAAARGKQTTARGKGRGNGSVVRRNVHFAPDTSPNASRGNSKGKGKGKGRGKRELKQRQLKRAERAAAGLRQAHEASGRPLSELYGTR